jgi:hypothetical protein
MTSTIVDTSVFTELHKALDKAINKHPPYPSLHHAISVIDEEFTELKTEAYRQEVDGDALRKEALHVAATAIRLLLDLDPGRYRKGGVRQPYKEPPARQPYDPGFYKADTEGWNNPMAPSFQRDVDGVI